MDNELREAIESLSYHVDSNPNFITVPAEALKIVVEWAQSQISAEEERDVPHVGDRYSFPNTGVLRLESINEAEDRYIFVDHNGDRTVWPKAALNDKALDVRLQAGDRVKISGMKDIDGTIRQVSTAFTHWPYEIETASGHSYNVSAKHLRKA